MNKICIYSQDTVVIYLKKIKIFLCLHVLSEMHSNARVNSSSSSDLSDKDMREDSDIDKFIVKLVDQQFASETNGEKSEDEMNSSSLRNPFELSDRSAMQSTCNLSPSEIESFSNSNSDSSDSSLEEVENKFSTVYNKIIQLFGDKHLLETSDHNFHHCNICSKRNPLDIDNGTEGSQASFNNNEKPRWGTALDIKTFLEGIINGIDPGFNAVSFSSNSFEWDALLKIAKLIILKCYKKMMDISEFQSIVFQKSFTGGSFLENNTFNRNVLEELFKKESGILEDFIIKENLPYVKLFLEKIISQMNEDNSRNFPDFIPLQILLKKIMFINVTKNTKVSFESDIQELISEKNVEELRDEAGKNQEEFNRSLVNHVKNITSDYDSDSSSSSLESNIESIIDCENKIIRIPPKTSFFLSYLKIKSSNIRKIYKLAYRMDVGIIGKSVSDITTHVIVPESFEASKEKDFTYSYLAAIAQKSYIVTFQWVTDCLQAARILPPLSYTPKQPGALSCLKNNRGKLFENFHIYFPNTEDLESVKRNKHLAELCGAVISNNLRIAKKRKILVSDNVVSPELIWQCFDSKVFPLHSSWLHDSIFLYEMQPLKPYCLVNTSDEILAYFSNEFQTQQIFQ